MCGGGVAADDDDGEVTAKATQSTREHADEGRRPGSDQPSPTETSAQLRARKQTETTATSLEWKGTWAAVERAGGLGELEAGAAVDGGELSLHADAPALDVDVPAHRAVHRPQRAQNSETLAW